MNQFTPNNHQSLPLSLLAKSVDSIIHKSTNSICHFHCLAANSAIIVSTVQPFSACKVFISSLSATVRGVIFTRRVMSLMMCIPFWPFVKEYLTSWYKFCTDR